MTHTVTQTGLYAFDGVHVCQLAEGDALAVHDRLPHHYEPRESVLLTGAHLDALAADGWATADRTPAPLTDEERAELLRMNAEFDAAPEPDAPAEQKQADPVTENKAIDPVAETKPAAPLTTKKSAPKKKR